MCVGGGLYWATVGLWRGPGSDDDSNIMAQSKKKGEEDTGCWVPGGSRDMSLPPVLGNMNSSHYSCSPSMR